MLGRAAKLGLRAGIGGMVGGPAVAAGAAIAPGVVRGGARGGRAMRAGARALSDRTSTMHAQSRLRGNRVVGAMARRPILTALGAYSVGSAYTNLPGPQASSRNQSSRYLQSIRNHQRSTAMSNFVGSSSGSFA